MIVAGNLVARKFEFHNIRV